MTFTYDPAFDTLGRQAEAESAGIVERISRVTMLLDIAATVAKRGTCQRLQVGAVIARDGRILSTGYNGAPADVAHCGPATCDKALPCTHAVHAELNAIAYAARHGVELYGAGLYCTDGPCVPCAQAIISAGLRGVWYRRPYRDPRGVGLLRAAGLDSIVVA